MPLNGTAALTSKFIITFYSKKDKYLNWHFNELRGFRNLYINAYFSFLCVFLQLISFRIDILTYGFGEEQGHILYLSKNYYASKYIVL